MEAGFLDLAADRGVLAHFDAVAGHNFWLDFGPVSRLEECGLEEFAQSVEGYSVTTERRLGRALPIVFSEVGASSFTGDELQA
jgi:predicted P-loop ATPase/GTPase